MVWASAGNLPEQNKSNECVNRPPGTAVKKYAGTHDLPCTDNKLTTQYYNPLYQYNLCIRELSLPEENIPFINVFGRFEVL